ncbi:MAG: phnA protein [Deltaproteobacteria bacterium]|nr:MAG: phnA protein [Deltaproteobacteria bacterium]
MARGRDAHQARLGAVAALGKNLSRRASSRCELCEGDEDLRVMEVPPVDEDPDEDAAILACRLCREDIDSKKLYDLARLRFLETAMWSETAPAQVAAVRLLRRVAEREDWAREALDGLWLDEDMQARVDAT